MRDHFTPTRMAAVAAVAVVVEERGGGTDRNKRWWGYGKTEMLHIASKTVKWYGWHGKHWVVP